MAALVTVQMFDDLSSLTTVNEAVLKTNLTVSSEIRINVAA